MNEQEEGLEKERLRALIESQHCFPGRYTFKVIYRNESGMDLRIREAIEESTEHKLAADQVAVRASSGARFISMTLDLEVRTAEDVLDIYAVLGKLENIVSCF